MGRTIVWRTYLLGDGTTADLAQVEQPHRAPTLESEILVPAAEAAISGVLFGCAATALAVWLAHAPWWPCLPIAIAVMTGGGWIAALREERQTLWKTESLSVLSSQPEVPPSPPVPSVPLLANPGECAVSAATAQRDEHVAQRRDELVAFVRTCATRGCGESAHGVTQGPGRHTWPAVICCCRWGWRAGEARTTKPAGNWQRRRRPVSCCCENT